ncbi:sigma-54-dependent Fis family transcriptional regulator [Flavobacterium alkalisoli]|uniref:Sigma-54-dependent Fis family transcriptional regulator n=1 Tax=Flavobacterium alkalisoli TaxID=2602769 RepID=A0A5B9FTR6_9FLAO|nr:sigma-54 dependent transcriptional regulator [Flavobacterium alkalisoli]QEE50244.1 sigma-54-dependent Fis family transcriptional regulator [Flavobacterium alkalisoli]
MNEKILIVEDEFIVANDLKMILKKGNYNVMGIASSATQARTMIAAKRPDWVLLDIILKGNETGIDLARELAAVKIPFLFISANTNQSILEAVKKTGPYGFMVKPFREKDLLVMLDIARYRHKIENQQELKTGEIEQAAPDFGEIIGQSPNLKEVLHKVSLVAPTDTSVLITGESGTGKERIAHALHKNSDRKNKPLVVVNCAALPLSLVESELFGHEKGAFTGANSLRTGKFEQANGGTVFLDEIGELPLDAQVKLLRVLQEKEIERIGGNHTFKVDVRIIAATNRNLEKEVAEGRFRLDLYYRLNVFPIELPPLKNRKDDILLLANHFLLKFNKANGKGITGFSDKAQQQLLQYSWPGNIRELEHLIERSWLLATGHEIDSIELPADSESLGETAPGELSSLEDMERKHIMQALQASGGKVFGSGGAAEMLKIPATTLYSKMKKLGIQQEHY